MRITASAVLALAAMLATPPAQALRCGNDLVREQDPAYEVRRACGSPDWVRTYAWGHGAREEIWHYNFGPNELIRVLRFRDGRLQRITTAGYGFPEDPAPGACRPVRILEGMSARELLERCGRPVQREGGHLSYRPLRPKLPGHGRLERLQPAFVEEWYYDFGSGYLPRRITLVNGIVARVETTP